MSESNNFQDVFDSLKPLLSRHSKKMTVVKDTEDTYYLNTEKNGKNGKPQFFGAVQIKKKYVSFHLMPVYMDPSLLDDIGEPLTKQMQGKSCFNFNAVDNKLFSELKKLAKASYDYYVKEGHV